MVTRAQLADMQVGRATSRLIVLDPTGRVLLLGSVLPNQERTIWVTPGGGLELLEDEVSAAQRELAEEPGVSISRDKLGRPVAHSAGRWTSHDGVVYEANDTFFAVRLEVVTPTTSGFTQLEQELVKHVRWWTPDELDMTQDIVFPAGLSALVRRLAQGDYPTEPIELPWS